jgi:pilus assembly protein Flp/PilA
MVWISETGQLNALPQVTRKEQGNHFPWLGRGREKRNRVNNLFLKVFVQLQSLACSEEGQDLVEYALVVALIAFGATAGMKSLATGLNTAFLTISSALSANVT